MFGREVKSIHFVGIGGTAMAAVAALCRDLGYPVTGSEQNMYPPMSTFLAGRGIRTLAGYSAANLDPRPDLIVIGNAMKRGNPEIERVLDEQLPYTSLPELVRELLLAGHHSVVVAGTHGKTTTTALLAWVLESAGRKPGFLIGGVPNNFPDGGARAASPAGCFILNNIEFDHADIFADLAAVKRAFRQLVAVVPRRGLILANGDDANVREVVEGSQSRVRFFNKTDAAGFTMPLPGEHNLRNTAAVIVCATELGLTYEQIQQGLATFQGVKRRMEVHGEAAGITVLDDFAHHPTAIAETIRAIREKYPARRIWALFEPRSNTTRRNVFQNELAAALALADGVYIGRVDRLDELPESERLKPDLIVQTLRKHSRPAAYCATTEDIIRSLLPRLQSGDVVAVFSNGKFDGIHDKLLTAVRARPT